MLLLMVKGKLFLAYIVCVSARMRFYFVWILGEVAGILSGLGYSGMKGKQESSSSTKDPVPRRSEWSRLRNQDILGIEFCTSCAMLPIGWNIQVSMWLRHYAYERFLQLGVNTNFAVLLTQLVSTVWHGVYPGYLIFFVSSAICIQGSKLIHKRVSALKSEARTLTIPFLFLLTQLQNACAGVRHGCVEYSSNLITTSIRGKNNIMLLTIISYFLFAHISSKHILTFVS